MSEKTWPAVYEVCKVCEKVFLKSEICQDVCSACTITKPALTCPHGKTPDQPCEECFEPMNQRKENEGEAKREWIKVIDNLPSSGQPVEARYVGVYDYREVAFWFDGGGNPHFGLPNEPDGKGSQPATHWRRALTKNEIASAWELDKSLKSDSPLRADVIDGQIVISMGIERLDCDKERTGIEVENYQGFAEDICRMLCRDNEIGATMLTDLFDAAMIAAIEDGSIHASKKDDNE
jgi:hypothetical protein